jgi:hypothetical protein
VNLAEMRKHKSELDFKLGFTKKPQAVRARRIVRNNQVIKKIVSSAKGTELPIK